MCECRVNTGNVELDKKIEEWLSWDRNPTTHAEIKNYLKNGDINYLSKVLLNRISFGTAGLRGKMGAGYFCMNDLVIIQTAQGLLKHLEEENLQLLKSNGIVFGYDGRHNSKRYVQKLKLRNSINFFFFLIKFSIPYHHLKMLHKEY